MDAPLSPMAIRSVAPMATSIGDNGDRHWRSLVTVPFFPVSCHLGPKGPNGKIVLIRFVHVHKKYKTRVGDRQRKSGYCGILAQKVSVRPSARINYAPLSNLTMYTTGF